MTQPANPVTAIFTDQASPPGGHYSQAVVHGGLVFVSGQLGFEPGTLDKRADSVEQETRNCLTNLARILEASGSSLQRLVKVTIYISDVGYWPVVNRIYGEYLGDHKPARAIVPCGLLHHGFHVEIEAVAATA